MKTRMFGVTMALGALCPGPAAPKSRLQTSQAALRNYEWIETTVVSRNDEQKVEIPASAESRSGGPPGPLPPGRLMKKLAVAKKDNIDYEPATGRLLRINVSTWMDDTGDAIELDVLLGELPDGTVHVAKSRLRAAAKRLDVTIDNSGYRRAARGA